MNGASSSLTTGRDPREPMAPIGEDMLSLIPIWRGKIQQMNGPFLLNHPIAPKTDKG
jgi:hypothetical protein